MDLVMDNEQRKEYAFSRKLHPELHIRDRQRTDISHIIIHNAQKTEEVEALFYRVGVTAIQYFPERSTEAHYYVPGRGDLHVVNSRGVTRLMRDEDLANTLQEEFGRKIKITVDHYDGDSAKASKRFEDFAFDEVADVFCNLDRSKIDLRKSVTVLIGPHVSNGLDGIDVTHQVKNEYLNYKILNINGEQVVFFDYIFADQAKNVLGQLYSTVNAYFDDVSIDVFHYGKVGLLNIDSSVGDICLPIAALDESKIVEGDMRPSPIHNALVYHPEISNMFIEILGVQPITGRTVNTTSVLRQTRQSLERCLDEGGDFLDMEWSVMASLDHGFSSCYPRIKNIHYFFAGVGSDKPLEGQTLGNTEHPRDGERKIAHTFIEMIRRRTSA